MNTDNTPRTTPPPFDRERLSKRLSISGGLATVLVLLCVCGGAFAGFFMGMRVNTFMMSELFDVREMQHLAENDLDRQLRRSEKAAEPGDNAGESDESDLSEVAHYDNDRQFSYTMNDYNKFVSIPRNSGWVQAFNTYAERVEIEDGDMITMKPGRFVIKSSISELKRLCGTGSGKRTLRLKAAYGKKDSVDVRLTNLLVNYRSDSICDVSMTGYIFHK